MAAVVTDWSWNRGGNRWCGSTSRTWRRRESAFGTPHHAGREARRDEFNRCMAEATARLRELSKAYGAYTQADKLYARACRATGRVDH